MAMAGIHIAVYQAVFGKFESDQAKTNDDVNNIM